MTEMVEGSSVSTSTPPVSTTSTPIAQSAPEATTSEKTFRQSEVNEIVKKAKYGAVEDYRRMQSERPDYLQQKYGDVAAQHQTPQTANNLSHDEVRRLASEEAQRLRDQWVSETRQRSEQENAERTVKTFWDKISTGREKFEDYETVIGDIEYARFPNVVQLLASHIDNADEMLYELGNDRIKMANLEALAERSPRDAIVQAKRLAESIKVNRDAQRQRQAREPLSQLRPSNTGTDTGVMSVKDYRRKYKA